MPFKSQKQAGWMFEHKPDLAKRFAKDTPDGSPDLLRKKAKQSALQKLMAYKP